MKKAYPTEKLWDTVEKTPDSLQYIALWHYSNNYRVRIRIRHDASNAARYLTRAVADTFIDTKGWEILCELPQASLAVSKFPVNTTNPEIDYFWAADEDLLLQMVSAIIPIN